MDHSPTHDYFMELLFSIIHSINIVYFTLLVANIVHNFISIPVKDANSAIQDILAVLCFFLGAIIFSLSNFFTQYWQSLEVIGAVTLIWTSTVPFIYFQYYNSSNILPLLLSLLVLSGVRCTALIWHRGRDLCRQYYVGNYLMQYYFGLVFLAAAPVIWTYFKPSNPRYAIFNDYVWFLRHVSLGGLLYICRIPERLGMGVRISQFAMHAILIGSAVVFSVKLITAYSS